MKRVMVIGCSGAGKSTFSKRLHSITKIEVIHLDQYYWKSNWVESNTEEWTKTAEALTQKEEWIMDGNYGRTMDIRIERADTIVYLDYSALRCLWRITKRTWKYFGQERPDMHKGCKERFDLDFYHYVATYNIRRRKKNLKKLDSLKHSKSIVILKNDKEVSRFLSTLDV